MKLMETRLERVAAGPIVIPEDETRWRFSRASGPGGQNVNKVETRVELLFHVPTTRALDPERRALVMERLAGQLDFDGYLHVVASSHRSQRQNRDEALERLQLILSEALRPRKHRRPTRIPAAVREARLREKRHRSEVKRARGSRVDRDEG